MNQQWQALKEHFYQARHLPADRKEELLKDLAAQNPSLADDLNVLFRQQERAEGFMEEPAWQWLSTGTVQDQETLAPGTHLGSYRVERLLGQGGMGAVYLASQDEPVKRQVALKLMAGLPGDQRFRQEQQTLARLEHPNIARYYDAGCSEDGDPFLVMEYLAGVPITRWCQGKPLEQRLDLFRQLCRGVAFAHANRIIHRDIKPENVLVVDGPDGPIVKVIDFGIAKDQSTKAVGFTRTGQFLGTPDYISPEQAGLIPVPVGPASDIYALGVLLYQLVSDQLPYDFENKPLFEWLKILAKAKLSPPSACLENATPDMLYRDLDAIVLKAMEKEPGLRYASVEDLIQDVDHALKGDVVGAARPDLMYRVRKFHSRHHLKLKGLAVLGLLVFSVLAWTIYSERQNSRITAFWNRYHELKRDLNQAYLLPLHDIRPYREALNVYVKEMDSNLPRTGKARTAAHHLLGKANMELDQLQPALRHLSIAEKRDPLNPEISADKGLCEARLATANLTQAKNIGNRKLRELELERIRQLYVDQSIENLARALHSEPAQKAYLNAYFHYLNQDYDSALSHTKDAIAEDQYHYRAYLLQGHIHEAKADACFNEKDRVGHKQASSEARAAFEKAVEIARGYPSSYEALGKHLLDYKKRMRGDPDVDEPALLILADYYISEGLKASPNKASFIALMAAIEIEGVIDDFEIGNKDPSPFDRVNELAEAALRLDPCEPTALICLGQTSYYLARIEYPKMQAVIELTKGIEALETLLAQNPGKPVNYRALVQLYSSMAIATAPVGLEPWQWHKKSLDLNGKLAKFISKNYTYHLTNGMAYRNYAQHLGELGADPSSIITLGLDSFYRVSALVPKQEMVPASLAELHRLAAQADGNRGRNPQHHVNMTILHADLASPRPYAPQRFFNVGNALAALAFYQTEQGADPTPTFWEALGVYHQGLGQFPEAYRLYNGAAFLCLDHAERLHAKGRDLEGDEWMNIGLAFSRQGQKIKPNYAGFTYHEGRAALMLGCEDEFFTHLEGALAQSPYSLGSLKFAPWYPALKEHPRMKTLRNQYHDHSGIKVNLPKRSQLD